jgi:hypothetical protein
MRQLSNARVKVTFDGEAYGTHYTPGFKIESQEFPQSDFSAFSTVSFLQMSALRNYYDMQSNGTAVQLWQDPANPNNMHAVYMFSNQPDDWTDRTMQYFFSSDKGVTWMYIVNVPSGPRAGFGTITGLSNGAALIATHTNQSGINGSTLVRTQIYADVFAGFGAFTRLDPGSITESQYVWPRIIATQDISQPNKFVFAAATNVTEYDSSFWNAGTSLTNSGFNGYKKMNGNTAESYAIGRGADGRIGLTFVANDNPVTTEQGDLYFMESTNGGNTFNSPTKIFNSNFLTDSSGAFRGISLVYQGNSPCIVFETVKMDGLGGVFFESPSSIRYWSPSVNGGNSLVIANQSNVPYAPALGNTDVELSICRPSIGISGDGNMLFCAMMVQSPTRGNDIDTTSYNDIYLTRSSNNGANWITPERITPTTPRNDWTYASISPYNDYNASNYYVNMTMQKDTIPGSKVNGIDTRTFAKPYFVRVSYSRSTTPPAVPTLLTPANNATNQSLTPTLTWSETGSYYRVQVSTNSGFTNIITDQNNILTGSYQIPSPILTSNTTYYWRVNATNDAGTSSYSSAFAFTTTTSALPAAPTLITPSLGSNDISLTPAFDWSDVSGAASYRIQVSLNNTFSSNVLDSQNITLSQFTMPFALNGNTTYFWRVSAKNAAGTGPYSSIFNFNTVPPVPASPSLIAPANGATGVASNPLMQWSSVSNAASYNVQISTTSGFTNIIYDQSSATTNLTVPAGVLVVSTQYYWRVRAVNVSGAGAFSSSFSFTTAATTLPAPALISPADGSLGVILTPNMQWQSVTGATSYNIQLATDVNFNNIIYSSNPTGTSHTIPAGNLALNTLYFWRVRGNNASGFGGFSSTWNFRSTLVGILSNVTVIVPTEFKLYNNYPNPFNPATTIKFDIPENTDVKIKVFDMTGKMLRELFNSSLPAGTYETNFDASSFASGIYYFRIEAGKFNETKKMILVK